MIKKLILLGTFSIVFVSCGQESDGADAIDGVAPTHHRVFITKATYTGNLIGIIGANQKCAQAASNAGLVRTYEAIISDTTGTAGNNLAFTGGIYTVDSAGNLNLIMANGADLLSDTSLLNSIDYYEDGTAATGVTPWTGTDSNGNVMTGDHCNNWASSNSGDSGFYGSSDKVDGQWTENNSGSCDASNPIFCVSQ